MDENKININYVTEIIYNSYIKTFCDKNNKILNEYKKIYINTYCCCCGKKISNGYRLLDIISSNFSDISYFKNKKSDIICIECSFCIKLRDFRTFNFIADGENIIFFRRNDIEKYIFKIEKYVSNNFIICITENYKKHNSFKCRINCDYKNYNIYMENINIYFDYNESIYIYNRIKELYNVFSKKELYNLKFAKIYNIEKFGINKYKQYYNELQQYIGTNIYNFIIYIINKGDFCE